jgi:hypothetical protein
MIVNVKNEQAIMQFAPAPRTTQPRETWRVSANGGKNNQQFRRVGCIERADPRV